MQTLTLLPLVLFVLNIAGTFAIPTIEAVGSKYFTSDGKQFFMKGVAYQLTEDDPLIDVEQCTLDAALMQQLGANAIRVYHVNGTADHSACMSAFAAVGIYLWVDLDSFKTYIRLGSETSWTQNKSDSYRQVMDNFQQYPNTAGFFVGNEVLNVIQDSGSAPYVLAAAVDMAQYRDDRGYRKIPIGYSATDTGALPMLQDYFVCRPNVSERLEFYALNSYRWCGAAATYNTSGYNQLEEAAEGYPVPIFFSEVGCNTVPPRDFNDQNAIFGPEMDGTWSGSIIYEWIQEMNKYGLIQYGPELGPDVNTGSSIIQGFTRQGTPTPILPDFTNLQSRWATLNPTGTSLSAYSTDMSSISRTCPSFTAGGWTVDPSSPLPTLGQAAFVGITPMSSTSSTTSASTYPSQTPSQSGSSTKSTSASATATGRATRTASNPFGSLIHEEVVWKLIVVIPFVVGSLMMLL